MNFWVTVAIKVKAEDEDRAMDQVVDWCQDNGLDEKEFDVTDVKEA